MQKITIQVDLGMFNVFQFSETNLIPRAGKTNFCHILLGDSI